ncbi:MAG: DUF72 domain-containing protein [Candidatus Polarisedimenticolia bacterium]
MDTGGLLVGTAGWSFPDWEGVVYPRGAGRSGKALGLMARTFDVMEINVSFYRPILSSMARSWLDAVAAFPAFRFTAKLWRGFTHEREETHEPERAAWLEGIAPLREAARLGAVLAQFPISFRNTAPSRAYLESLLDRFAELPLVVELRHVSWMTDEVIAMLTARQVGWCNVDQPLLGDAVPPSTMVTSPVAYVRLHGRNRTEWFRKDAGRDARYDYLYSEEEIDEWALRIGLMRQRAPGAVTFIIANNHYRGQAAVNALELKSALTGGPVEVPDLLLSAYPRLARVSARSGRAPGGQAPLPL